LLRPNQQMGISALHPSYEVTIPRFSAQASLVAWQRTFRALPFRALLLLRRFFQVYLEEE